MACHRRPPLASLLVLAALLAVAAAAYPPAEPHRGHKQAEVVVEGLVYCQACAKRGTWSLAGARPLPSAKVSVLCRDPKGRTVFYKSFPADGSGYFYAPLRGLELKGRRPADACVVYLLSSADGSCNQLTNINYGINGAKLRETNGTVSGSNYEAVLYAAGPLAFRPTRCAPKRHY